MNVKEVLLPFDVKLLPSKTLKAGKFTCMYEAGNLRYIKWGNSEIIRMIYGTVRNENWETVPATITNEKIEENENEFNIQYTAMYKAGGIYYRADFNIEGKKDNSIIFSMKGEALSNFKRNRIGLCVLHPIKECAGRKANIIQPGGNSYQSMFPEYISPHQPFLNIQKIEWITENDVQVKIKFDGDIFETEDQRNWSDSSYKTYSTPLSLPFPVLVKEGERIEQKITLQVSGDLLPQESDTTSTAREEKIPFPKIGYCRSKNQQPLTEENVKLLKEIPFDHYRVELYTDEASWLHEFSIAVTEARLLQSKLELVVFFTDEYQKILNEFVSSLESAKDIILSVLVLHKNQNITPGNLLEKVYTAIKQKYPLIKIGYGTDDNFAELNRNRPQGTTYDFVSFSVNPQVHTTDIRSLLENLENQTDMIVTAKSFAEDKEVYISPVTHNTQQHTWLNAFWTSLCIQNLSEAGYITFYEITGEDGIIPAGKPSPLYQVLKMIKEFGPKWIIKRYKNGQLVRDDFKIERADDDQMIFKCYVPA